MGKITLAVIVSLWVIPTTVMVNCIVPEPYMDEIFHIPQAQQYCKGNFGSWDPMITTPPGLYVFSLGVSSAMKVQMVEALFLKGIGSALAANNLPWLAVLSSLKHVAFLALGMYYLSLAHVAYLFPGFYCVEAASSFSDMCSAARL
ncbi:hypothetical protein VNO78_15859 [Psophocarpus tetragonolobus]|uniref:Dol-P-Glc:Glc(2)Man(9)GlcNAc(2)-PP-Dol alpha-1,2-glucosyltransferase n=1 Tax=Psophocarpus tetragonolobus TaxID=3891 RepID=A0AAN9XKA4_PSOTE